MIHSLPVALTTDLAETCAMIAQATLDAVDSWIIGSAAVVLHGGVVRHVKDVDLMMSAPDAETFVRRSGGVFRKCDDDDLFRSKVSSGCGASLRLPLKCSADSASPQRGSGASCSYPRANR